jgi:predicted peptidase
MSVVELQSEAESRPWAAAVILAGAGDAQKIARAARVPIWACHAADDTTIPIARMQEMISAFKAAHGKPRIMVIGKGGHHVAWTQPLKDPQLFEWLFAQRRSAPDRKSRTAR